MGPFKYPSLLAMMELQLVNITSQVTDRPVSYEANAGQLSFCFSVRDTHRKHQENVTVRINC